MQGWRAQHTSGALVGIKRRSYGRESDEKYDDDEAPLLTKHARHQSQSRRLPAGWRTTQMHMSREKCGLCVHSRRDLGTCSATP
jgi:hypothetical protein